MKRLLEWLPLIAVLTHHLHGNGYRHRAGCEPPWFGVNCTFECHCTGACQDNGECVNNMSCETGYFGPGCQYVDIGQSHGSSTGGHPSKTTCNPNQNQRTFDLMLNGLFRFSWAILYVSKADFISNPVVRINGRPKTCFKKKVFTVHRSVHVFCTSDILMQSLVIDGFIVPYICSIVVSGGRLIPYTSDAPITNSTDPGQTHDGKECTIDPYKLGNNQLHIEIQDTVMLYTVRLHARRNYTHQLQGFTMHLLSHSGNVLLSHTDNTSYSYHHRHFDVTISTIEPVAGLAIQAAAHVASGTPFLGLCKVEVFGEIFCPVNKYGVQCEHTCACLSSDLCEANTGMCLGKCPLGWYAINCKKPCPANCLNRTCHPLTGLCSECIPGYTGVTCVEECPVNMYGRKCALPCPVHCQTGSCDRVTGTCSQCQQGRVGVKCEGCPVGRFGVDCQRNCSAHCGNMTCDLEHGTCASCTDGRIGNMCTECPLGKFGLACDKICPQNCVDEMCHQESGHCFSCKNSYHGHKCEVTSEEPNMLNNMALYGVTFATVLLICGLLIVVLSFNKPKRQAKTEEC